MGELLVVKGLVVEGGLGGRRKAVLGKLRKFANFADWRVVGRVESENRAIKLVEFLVLGN
ncbi:hypothetical protein [Corynebacterium camporealensis]|uniref:hypothetical protein n=1 Tax=Corynebacterium camporealensis TaxID=161896 RepID=UPI00052C9313|nr:hypothetical protein [Corynebacterium camporealensis]